EQDAAEHCIVLDHEHEWPGPVAGDNVGRSMLAIDHTEGPRLAAGDDSGTAVGPGSGRFGALGDNFQFPRHIERKAAARSGLARQHDLAAEQRRKLTADRESEAGAAESAAGGAVPLLESLEND